MGKNYYDKKRVAAYARVSTGMSSQESSYENQVEVYTEKIKNNPEWIFAGIYADAAVSGTTDERPEFKRMMNDCQNGRIDLILVKSISRFSRNVLITIENVRKLNEWNVDIVFEKENIDTSKPYSEMLLTILAAFAQEESRNNSERIKSGLYMRAVNGHVRWKPMFGYQKTADKDYEINEKEAEVVRKIFMLYEHGRSQKEISRMIKNEYGLMFAESSIRDMLSNPKYAGDICTNRYFTKNHLTHKVAHNKGEVERVLIKDHHEAIIDRKTYDRVQKIKNLKCKKHTVLYPFGEKLCCGVCGRQMMKEKKSPNSPGTWFCSNNSEACRKVEVSGKKLEKTVYGLCKNLLIKNKIEDKKPEYWWIDELTDKIEVSMVESGNIIVKIIFRQETGEKSVAEEILCK